MASGAEINRKQDIPSARAELMKAIEKQSDLTAIGTLDALPQSPEDDYVTTIYVAPTSPTFNPEQLNAYAADLQQATAVELILEPAEHVSRSEVFQLRYPVLFAREKEVSTYEQVVIGIQHHHVTDLPDADDNERLRVDRLKQPINRDIQIIIVPHPALASLLLWYRQILNDGTGTDEIDTVVMRELLHSVTDQQAAFTLSGVHQIEGPTFLSELKAKLDPEPVPYDPGT